MSHVYLFSWIIFKIILRSLKCLVFNNVLNFLFVIQLDFVETEWGNILVAIQGDRTKPAILTYHDLGLNRKFGPELTLHSFLSHDTVGSVVKPEFMWYDSFMKIVNGGPFVTEKNWGNCNFNFNCYLLTFVA